MAPVDAKALSVSAPIVVISRHGCPYCVRIKSFLPKEYPQVSLKVYEADDFPSASAFKQSFVDMTGQSTYPYVFVNGELIGGCDDTLSLHRSGTLTKKITAARI